MSTAEFTKLADPPLCVQTGSCVQINENEFMIATAVRFKASAITAKDDIPGFYIFNIHLKQWRLFMKYPDCTIYDNVLTFDKARNTIYMYYTTSYGSRKHFLCINMSTKASFTINNDLKAKESRCVATEHEIHMIGDWDSNKHCVFNKNTAKFNYVHTFSDLIRYYWPGLVYVPTQNAILAIGGYGNGASDNMYLQKYCLKDKEWKVYKDVVFRYCVISMLLTMDEKHVIMVPDCDNESQNSDDIFILDILDEDKYDLRTSKVAAPKRTTNAESPFAANRRLVLTGGGKTDQIIVSGYLRRFCKNNMIEMIPNDLIGIFVSFYSAELLHCIRMFKCKNDHSIIAVQDVLA